MLPIYFVLSALLAGTAILISAIVLSYKASGKETPYEINEIVTGLGKLLALFLGVFLLFTIWNLLTAQYGRIPEEFESVMLLINGPLAMRFWTLEISLGLLVPLFILIYTRAQKNWGVIVASLLVVLGMFAARYDFVLAGQLVPVIGKETLWQYTPSIIEILTVLGAFSLSLFLYSLGYRLLSLEDSLTFSSPVENRHANSS